jgi:DNA-binding Lrp family transcriptional regulator
MLAQGSSDLALLNEWQHGFPLVPEPFVALGEHLGLDERAVLDACDRLQQAGAISRIGGVFSPGAGGAGLLAAMAVPSERMAEVAALVSAHPGVNHNYQREHDFNLWFVMTGCDAPAVEAALATLEQATGLSALRLRLQRAYRIDLGFDLRHATAPAPMRADRAASVSPLDACDWQLAQQVEAGLQPVSRPYDLWAQACGLSVAQVLGTLEAWVERGTLKRFGVVVRHHELGFSANAMTVFDVPDELVDSCGEVLARQPGVTLAYRRERAPQWPYNLYCMVHGTDRAVVHEVLDRVRAAAELGEYRQAVLFSTRRFKQTGARRFRDVPVSAPAGLPREVLHAVA